MATFFEQWLDRRMRRNIKPDNYIQFADPAVESVVVARWGDGVGLKESVAATITEIPYRLFRNNTSIVSFDELEYFTSLTTIAQEAFNGCTNLESIVLPPTITTIGVSAFYNCGKLAIEIDLPNLTTLNRGSFNSTGITKIKNLGSVTTIPGTSGMAARCFGSCTSLTSVVLPNTVTTIEQGAFYNCTSLTTINFPTSITSIGANAFQNVPIAVEVNLPNLTTIGAAAFQSSGITKIINLGAITELPSTTNSNSIFRSCADLVSAVLSSAITNIGYSMFSDCPSMTTLTCLATTPPTLGNQLDASWQHIYVPAASVSAYQSASGWSSYASIIEAIPA